MTFPLAISFYTAGTPYEREIETLRSSCDQFGIDLHVESLESQGDWTANCAQKGRFVLNMLRQSQRPVLWLDADSEVVRYPVLFEDADFDFAAYLPHELLSGTLYFAFSTAALRLAERWAALCKEHPNIWDQRLLQRAFDEQRDQFQFKNLPQGYCKVLDCPWSDGARDEFVVHHQASRRLKGVASLDVAMDSYATHLEPTVACAVRSGILWPGSPLLELGCGEYSTPLLATIAAAQDRKLTVISSNPSWAQRFQYLVGPHCEIRLIEPEELPDHDFGSGWGMVLLDDKQLAKNRYKQLLSLAGRAKLVVLQDAQLLGRHGSSWRSIFQRYRYSYLYDRLTPQTLVVSSEANPAAWFQR